MYVTRYLFESAEQEIKLNQILHDFRRTGIKSVQSIWPDTKLGIFAATHLQDEFLQFSPHVHGVISAVGIRERFYPITMLEDGQLDQKEICQGWKRLIGETGMSSRAFHKVLQATWADDLSMYMENLFRSLREAFREDIDTENIAYQTLKGMTDEDITIAVDQIKQAVLNDTSSVHVTRLDKDYFTGEINPQIAFERMIRYQLRSPASKLDFKTGKDGMIRPMATINGKPRSIGKPMRYYQDLAKVASVKRVRMYQGYGLFQSNQGAEFQMLLTSAMNRGYPGRRKKVGQEG